MKTWEEIRDEVAGMLADGQPLEDVISKLEQRKNEMAKANLLKAMDDMKKPKPMTHEEYIRNCSTEELATMIYGIAVYDTLYDRIINIANPLYDDGTAGVKEVVKWLKEIHI